ncbi:MAG: LytTR family DNA-binding domain-containing protein [Rhodoferax sp.]|uniref:LytR/AlgR family response regulator transcription factor n=1 Tax=Rhodoferax sp. TaxID=50421 RepID=UPI00262E320A|nr:LytTR family DNA-binding domain-containing protein [Rhodoferax sp.]MDD5332195.1 LytTR family DNA-binding domain-containing protein [Rhodoferax sp.]
MNTALLADDEPLLLDELRALLQEAWPALEIVACAENGAQARRLIDELKPDIVFLDIRMPGMTGLELARLVPPGTQLVFVTAHAEYALDAFEHAAVDYLRKPVTPARLAVTVQRLQQRLCALSGTNKPLRFVQAWIGHSMRVVEVEHIAALRSELRYTRALSFDGDSLLLRTPLSELLRQLDSDLFWQVHRGCVINARAIERIERREDGELMVHVHGQSAALPVSRTHRGRFRGM